MGVNDLSNSVGSWSRFVQLKEAARERNSSLGSVKAASDIGNANEVSFSGILSAKHGANVYSSMSASSKAAANEPPPRAKSGPMVGNIFDSYA